MNCGVPTMSDCILRVEKLTNGYEVEIADPKITADNAKPKSSWQDPWKGYSFRSAEEVATFVGATLDKLSPPSAEDEFSAAFKAATSEDD